MFEVKGLEELKDLNADIIALRTSAKLKTQDILTELCSQFFNKYSNTISNFYWMQGYSRYDDNTYNYEEFSDTIYFNISNELAETEEYLKLKEIDEEGFALSVWDISWDCYLPEAIGDEFVEDLKHFASIFNLIDTSILIDLWGSSIKVIVTKDGIDTEYYDPD